jgi:hypothetical protein
MLANPFFEALSTRCHRFIVLDIVKSRDGNFRKQPSGPRDPAVSFRGRTNETRDDQLQDVVDHDPQPGDAASCGR